MIWSALNENQLQTENTLIIEEERAPMNFTFQLRPAFHQQQI